MTNPNSHQLEEVKRRRRLVRQHEEWSRTCRKIRLTMSVCYEVTTYIPFGQLPVTGSIIW